MKVRLLSAGAAQGLVGALGADLAAAGLDVDATYGAVGVIRDAVAGGEAADVVILSSSVVAELEASGDLVAGSAREIGFVPTGIAVRDGDPLPDVSTPAELKAALEAADAIFQPDPQKATAGIHLARVMRDLGVDPGNVRAYPNGHAAMTAMAVTCGLGRVIGCTQATEIIAAPGVVYVGPLPEDCALTTGYSIAIGTQVRSAEAARALIALLVSDGTRGLRERSGFAAR